ncbi:MAG: MgtC/SapB family protein [Clostridia bacterium]|nr:MgtC/SapB family protein [Clostridia bacterium]
MFQAELILRLVIACVCGIFIGYERKSHAKAAGVRTHAVVACASAMMMILSKYAYMDVLEMDLYGQLVKIDPSRIASGVVSGIGFLGAGLIFINEKTVIGLTTAAGVWATCGIGMALGAGLYIIGIAAALLLLLMQIVLHNFPKEKAPTPVSASSPLHEVLAALETQLESQTQQQEGKTVYTITVTASNPEPEEATMVQV